MDRSKPRNRHSLLVRLLIVSIVVALCSIAATAWLAAQTTTVAIKQAQGQALADDAKIYDTLVGYAATHKDWAGVEAVVRQLSEQTGRNITLATSDRRPIVGSEPLPEKPSAVIDPLSVDSALATGQTADRIDRRAVGPFQLTPDEHGRLKSVADTVLACVQTRTGSGTLEELPSGRSIVRGPENTAASIRSCSTGNDLTTPMPTERAALKQLAALVNACLDPKGQPHVALQFDQNGEIVPAPLPSQASAPVSPDRGQVVAECVADARREQLRSYFAPAALLFVNTPSEASAGWDLSAASRWRIIGVAALVLLVTVLATVFAGARLVRPLRALTGAALRMKSGDDTARVKVSGSDEIAQLAAAFNEMADSREQLEGQRKAMVSDIAHELRTPLSNIRGWLEAAQDGVTKPDQALVTSLMEEALLLQHIVDDLQDLAMADAGRLRLHKEHVHLTDLLGQVVAANQPRANGVRLSLDVQGDPGLDADPVRLRQVVGNLVTNALRHTAPGGSVTVCGRMQDGWVVIDVVDTGTGISAEDLPKVFDRFWRAEKSRNRQSGGSGLGLAIVRQLAEAHGGTATAVSELGRGSTFRLRLPVDDTFLTGS
ncbi:sensor histidine kinase [Kibdelosporangium aridum]|uniref:histidine kinase n=1 Tax=Kibdelosporangium aridum TaxID=2030 RepID=A0A1W2FRF8_KIBAR|nr:ATP-binding protein [Kibdelosporangium aridum]SMD24206.1 two-component system, OmpR family, sensor histidine kinase BaeS [Kibdelosporangium aridum]